MEIPFKGPIKGKILEFWLRKKLGLMTFFIRELKLLKKDGFFYHIKIINKNIR